jgi:hypothetical protein
MTKRVSLTALLAGLVCSLAVPARALIGDTPTVVQLPVVTKDTVVVLSGSLTCRQTCRSPVIEARLHVFDETQDFILDPAAVAVRPDPSNPRVVLFRAIQRIGDSTNPVGSGGLLNRPLFFDWWSARLSLRSSQRGHLSASVYVEETPVQDAPSFSAYVVQLADPRPDPILVIPPTPALPNE